MSDELICEHEGCNATKGVKDFKRTLDDLEPDGEGPYSEAEQADWLQEPIALCPEHAGNHEPIQP